MNNFKIMLPPNKLPNVTQLRYPIYVQPKLAGTTAIYYKGSIYSKTGSKLELPKQLIALARIEAYYLEGQLIENTLPNSLKYVITDCMPYPDFEARNYKKPYSERYRLLNEVVASLGEPTRFISVANDLVADSAELIGYYKAYLSLGHKGLIMRDPEGLYNWGQVTLKTGELLKLEPSK